MLTQKLDVDDLQFEKGTFDGTMAYAQNKVTKSDSEQHHGNNYYLVSRFAESNFCCALCRGSRWSWLRDGHLSTKKSTSLRCTPAGQTHQVSRTSTWSCRIYWHGEAILKNCRQNWSDKERIEISCCCASVIYFSISSCSCSVVDAFFPCKNEVQTQDGGHGGWHCSVACCVGSCCQTAKWTLLSGLESKDVFCHNVSFFFISEAPRKFVSYLVTFH